MMECQPDMYVSKLRRVTEGTGGELEIRAVLPEENGETAANRVRTKHQISSKGID
jgi:hypothetical protein